MNSAHDSRPFFSFSVRLIGLADLAITLAVASTWIGFAGRWWWFFDLFSHFRLQCLVMCLAALVWLSVRKRWRLAGFVVLSLMANAWPVAMTTWVQAPVSTMNADWKLKVLCFNVEFSNKRNDEVLDYLRRQDADVIVLLEFFPALEKTLKPLEQSHPFGIRQPDDSPWGIGLYSRVPLKEVQVRTFGNEEPKSVTALIDQKGKVFRIIGTHPWPPMGWRGHYHLLDQCAAIGQFVGGHHDVPTLVVGDLNTTPWSVAMNTLRSRSGLDFRTPVPVWRPTWQVGTVFMIPIDHALCTEPLIIAERHIGPDLGSDHRPQELVIRWATP